MEQGGEGLGRVEWSGLISSLMLLLDTQMFHSVALSF